MDNQTVFYLLAAIVDVDAVLQFALQEVAIVPVNAYTTGNDTQTTIMHLPFFIHEICTCRDLARSQELALSFLFSVSVFIKFFIVAPRPLFGVLESDDSLLSGWASKHF